MGPLHTNGRPFQSLAYLLAELSVLDREMTRTQRVIAQVGDFNA
jgi:hypothetical protein